MDAFVRIIRLGVMRMKYLRFIAKRLIYMIITLIITTFVIFLLLHTFGADPIMTICANKTVSAEMKQSIVESYHLDESVFSQYCIWLKGVVKGDFGLSYVGKQSVGMSIMSKMTVTIGLILGTMIISFVIALPIGLLQAVKAGRKTDQILSVLLLILASTPSFLLGLISLLIVSKFLPGYPVSGGFSSFGGFITRISIPCVVLSFVNIGLLSRLMRSSAIDELNKHYVVTSKAKGMAFNKILKGDVVPNSIIPVLTVASIMIGGIISESMLVEKVFSLPGLGSMLVKAVSENDFPITMAITLILLILFMVSSLIMDIVYTFVDPRVKL